MANKVYQVAFEIAGKMGASFRSAFSSATAQMQTMGAQSVALRSNLKTLDAAYKSGVINVESYKNAQAQLKAQLEQTQAAQSRLMAAQSQQNEAARRAGQIRGAMVDTAIMATPLVAATKAAIDFESAMGGVAKQVQGARDDNGELTQTYYDMQSNVMRLSRELHMMPSVVADTTAAAARMGVQGTQALNDFVKMSVQMGVAFEGNGGQIAEAMAKIANIRGIKIDTVEGREQVRDLADTINYLDDQTTAKGPEIIEVMKRISSTASQSSFSNNELAALATTMLDLGKTPEIASTGLNALMTKMAAAPQQAKSFHEALAVLNLDAKQLQTAYIADSKGTVFGLLDQIRGMDKAQQAEVLTGLFGAEYQDDISALASGMDTLRKNFDSLNEASRKGSMEKEFINKTKQTQFAIDGVKQSLSEASISMTQTFLPSVQMMAGGLSQGAQMLSGFAQQHPVLTQAIVMTTAGLIGFRVAWLATSFVLAQYKAQKAGLIALYQSQNAQMVIARAQMLLQGAATSQAALAQWAMNSAMLANPITWVVAGIIGLVAVLYLLYQNFDTVRNAIDAAWKRFTETFPNAASFLQGIGDKVAWLADKFKNLIGLQKDSAQMAAGAGGVPTAAGVSIASNSSGGIYGHGAFLTTFAEEGPEAAIPLNGSPRAISLWEKAGDILGVSRGGTTINAPFSPVFHGAGPEIMPEVKQAADDYLDRLQAIFHQEERVKLA
ncbi:phage tail tape measure protein [Anaerospora hongkongensis]|uniref:phage tail tape measure protein n=1 Tax=Anaerospora hongkongensis TaxID=244830 RepID=UPI002FDB0E84